MRKLKFLMTSEFYPPYHIGGDSIHVQWLAEELAKQGHEVHVMFSLDAYELKKGKIADLRFGQSPVHLHPLRAPHGRIELFRTYLTGKSAYFSKEFDRRINEITPDVVHHHSMSLLGYDILRKRGAYLNLYTAHSYWLACQLSRMFKAGKICEKAVNCNLCAMRSSRPPQIWRRQKSFIAAVKDIDMVIAPSDYVRETLARMIDLPVVTIRNFVPEPPQNIPPSGFSNYFLYVGVLEEFKGIMELVRVFKEHKQEIRANLLIAGTGSLEKRLRSYINENGLADTIHLLGWRDHNDLYPLYHDAYALMVPSIWGEPFGLIAVESLSVGTPVITSDRGGLPEIANLQGEGFVCDLGQLKNAMIRIKNSRPDRQTGQNIYKHYFSPESFVTAYNELLVKKLTWSKANVR